MWKMRDSLKEKKKRVWALWGRFRERERGEMEKESKQRELALLTQHKLHTSDVWSGEDKCMGESSGLGVF